ncbi:hypothetical protein PS627_03055 [Pseudomonas fluorescens]|uniref:type II toxin-antitoxin system PrlF family antitoxin n=1 Tax=Pseudomonas fluorescens TaxID=294 RepID=UPI00125BB811|nr:type II toxin-antitoxin system PrlF family antitoxin [Pseudomonas fluorescens]CAG8868498.1 hypothetical protein PS627_03055 [Pseudomonas fluorescens]
MSAKGPVHIPESARQILDLDSEDRIPFKVREDDVIVSRTVTAHEDPAISALLSSLEADIRAGRNINSLPQDLAQTMLASAGHGISLDEDIEGKIAL